MFIEQIDNRLSFSLFSMWTEHAVYLYTQQHWNEEFVYILSSIVQLKTIKTHLPKQKKKWFTTLYIRKKKSDSIPNCKNGPMISKPTRTTGTKQ